MRHVEASHLQSWLVGKAWGDWQSESKWLWRLSKKHGSNGALGDIGIHIVDFASYGSGLDVAHVSARLKTFDKAPGNKIGEYDLDANDSFTMNVDFSNGAIGTIQASRTAAGQLDQLRLRVYGEKGSIEMIYDTGPLVSPRLHGTRSRHRQLARRSLRSGRDQLPALRRRRSARARRRSPRSGRAANIQKVLDMAQVSDREHRDVAVS